MRERERGGEYLIDMGFTGTERVPHSNGPLIVTAGQLVLVVRIPGYAGYFGGTTHFCHRVMHIHNISNYLLVVIHL